MDCFDKDELKAGVIAMVSIVLIASSVIGIGLWIIQSISASEKRNFMELCAAENHTAFECEYAYRSSEAHTSAVVTPVPVFVRH